MMSEETAQNLPNDNMSLILARLDSIDSRFDRVDSRLDGIDLRLDGLETKLDAVESRLMTLEDKVDKRLQETRPIWERALAEIAETRAEMHEGFGQFRTEMREEFGKVRIETDDGLRRVEGEINILNRNILDVRTDLQYLDRRITKLETEPSQ
jgi:archaellum component FlaC